ncbi:Photosystem I P700 chlorophyll a apoprotein A1 [Platanthera guangdongensis]|uniref:Photosystem I P700 chlorophyll a apoprotein A1 n=1 Tax=Platanthera guangdongensis TaxID=2320717 RepID=A0ABR2LUF2_9ASPA
MYFHGARFSNYEAWLSDPTHIAPSAQVVWPIVGQEILNGDVGGGFRGIQITSGFFQIWRASGITSELQLYCTAIGALDALLHPTASADRLAPFIFGARALDQ